MTVPPPTKTLSSIPDQMAQNAYYNGNHQKELKYLEKDKSANDYTTLYRNTLAVYNDFHKNGGDKMWYRAAKLGSFKYYTPPHDVPASINKFFQDLTVTYERAKTLYAQQDQLDDDDPNFEVKYDKIEAGLARLRLNAQTLESVFDRVIQFVYLKQLDQRRVKLNDAPK